MFVSNFKSVENYSASAILCIYSFNSDRFTCILKFQVMHSCSNDFSALWFQFDIRMNSSQIFDTQVIENQ